jgi:hypothetical protein
MTPSRCGCARGRGRGVGARSGGPRRKSAPKRGPGRPRPRCPPPCHFTGAPQILDLKQNAASKWGFRAVDGSGASMDGVLASQVARALQSGELRLKDGDVVRVTGYACNLVNDTHKLLVSSLEALAADSGAARDQAAPAPAAAAVKAEPGAASTPVAATKPAFGTPGPTPSPSEQ